MDPTNKFLSYKSGSLYDPDPEPEKLIAPSPLKSSLKASNFGLFSPRNVAQASPSTLKAIERNI
jgi:hypothetical protein